MPALRTVTLSAQPGHDLPGGAGQVRPLLDFPAGDLTHRVVPAGTVSASFWMEPAQLFYVVAGEGELWWQQRSDAEGATTGLLPRRSLLVPGGTRLQLRTSPDTSLVLLVASVPRWRPEHHHLADGGPWEPTAAVPAGAQAWPGAADPPQVVELPVEPVGVRGVQVRLLAEHDAGGLRHGTVSAGETSEAARHRQVEELGYVLDGYGELCRRQDGLAADTTLLQPGVAVDLATGITFQLRNTGAEPLRLLLLSLPSWPGPEETVAAEGCW